MPVVYRLRPEFHDRLPSWEAVTPIPAAAVAGVASAVLGNQAAADGLRARLAPRGLAAALAGATTTLVAADPTGQACGVGTLREALVRSGSRWSIPLVVVRPDHQRRGVGAGLVRRLLEDASRRGATVVFAETSPAWPAAAAFWEWIDRRLSAEPRP